MNKAINSAELKPAVTTGPLPSSRRISVAPDQAPDVRVPLREIILSEGAGEPNLPVYDTSGPYTDSDVVIDVNAGLRRNRIAWVRKRDGIEEYEGRPVQPVDNGNVSAEKAAKAFSAFHRPLRGLSVPSPVVGGGEGGESTQAVSAGATPTPNLESELRSPRTPQGGGEQKEAASR